VPVRTPFALSAVGLLTAALTTSLVSVAPAGARAADAAPAAEGAARAATAVTLGQTGGVPAVCTGTPTVPAATLLATEAPGRPSYIATKDGVLVSFTHVAGSSAGQIRAIVFADTATPGHKVVAAKSSLQTVKTSSVNTILIRLPIKAGQRLGLGYTTKQTVCLNEGVTGDSASFASPFNPDTTSDYFTTGSFTGAFRPNISAVLEPDIDIDGYGDISQDVCPQSALSQVACPAPDTVLTKQPKKHPKRARVKLKFSSTVAGSTFECKRDGHKFKPCHSPYKRRFAPGHHKLLVRAVSPAGIEDPTPVKVKFMIR